MTRHLKPYDYFRNALSSNNPFYLLKNMDRLFNIDKSFRDSGTEFDFGSFSPNIDVVEKEDDLIVTAEIPGVSKNEVKIFLRDDILTISGNKEKSEEHKNKNQYFSERYYGHFERSIKLPYKPETDSVSAKFDNGILEILIKKPQSASYGSKEIKIS